MTTPTTPNSSSAITATPPRNALDFVGDVPLSISVELGRIRMPVREVLGLTEGTVVGLDRSENDPLDLFANDRLIARGEVVALGDRIGIRITALVAKGGA